MTGTVWLYLAAPAAFSPGLALILAITIFTFTNTRSTPQ